MSKEKVTINHGEFSKKFTERKPDGTAVLVLENASVCMGDIPRWSISTSPAGSLTVTGDAIDAFAAYEELKGESVLVTFPCKVGDEIWFKALCECLEVQIDCTAGTFECPFENDCCESNCASSCERIFNTTVKSIYNNGFGWYIIPKHFSIEIPISDFGRTVFCSKEALELTLNNDLD